MVECKCVRIYIYVYIWKDGTTSKNSLRMAAATATFQKENHGEEILLEANVSRTLERKCSGQNQSDIRE